MYTKFHCSTNWNIQLQALLLSLHRSLAHPLYLLHLLSLCLPPQLAMRVQVDNHLDDKVLLDLGVLQTSLVGQELPGEEPPLAGHVNFFLFFQLFL